MYLSALELNNFYESEIGGIVQNILSVYIQSLWPETQGLRVLGAGYAVPYLTPYCEKAERVISMMPDRQGALSWSHNNKNSVFLSGENHMPIENCSIDRILLIHYLENCDNLRTSLREIWRILKPNGSMIIVVPNRIGVWARADWCPFGHGRPFTASQLCTNLRDCLFVPESQSGALFVPPIPDSPVLMRSANLIEKMGRNIFPFVAGVHIVEVSKQIYASIDNDVSGSAVFAKTKEIFGVGGRTVTPRDVFKYQNCLQGVHDE